MRHDPSNSNHTTKPRTRWVQIWLRPALGLCAALSAGLWTLTFSACAPPQPESLNNSGAVAPPDAQLTESLFDSAIAGLGQLDEYQDARLLVQITDQLSQWSEMQTFDGDWKPTSLIDTLPESLRKLPQLTPGRMRSSQFDNEDGMHLNQASWFRDVSMAHQGDEADPLKRATNLFDWVIRNVQLDARDSGIPSWIAMQTLVYGHATADQRSWIFAWLCRQQDIDVVMLYYPDHDDSKKWREWIPAALIDGELYLFDPELGLPLPGPDGQGVATLKQAAEDPTVLEQLDLDAEHRYPVRSSALQRVSARIVAEPQFLVQRMHLVEQQLTGNRRMVVTIDADRLAERLKACAHVEDVRLWAWPYQQIAEQRSPETLDVLRKELDRMRIDKLPEEPMDFRQASIALQRGRGLHLRGVYTGEMSANRLYPLARPSEDRITNSKLNDEQTQIVIRNKQDASYWLGLIAFDRGNFRNAVEYLDQRSLKAYPRGQWAQGARYNLARTYEALGELDQARALLEADNSPQQYGNKLRAKRLPASAGTAP